MSLAEQKKVSKWHEYVYTRMFEQIHLYVYGHGQGQGRTIVDFVHHVKTSNRIKKMSPNYQWSHHSAQNHIPITFQAKKISKNHFFFIAKLILLAIPVRKF